MGCQQYIGQHLVGMPELMSTDQMLRVTPVDPVFAVVLAVKTLSPSPHPDDTISVDLLECRWCGPDVSGVNQICNRYRSHSTSPR